MYWSSKKHVPKGYERTFLVCGYCLKYYKHEMEYCILCYKLYTAMPVEMILQQEEKKKQRKQLPSSLPTFSAADDDVVASTNDDHTTKDALLPNNEVPMVTTYYLLFVFVSCSEWIDHTSIVYS
jgi:hypothetical protein